MWERSDVALGRGLVIRQPRVALTYWWRSGIYTVTGPTGGTRTGLTLAAVLGWCEDIGLPKPTDRDLAWLERRE